MSKTSEVCHENGLSLDELTDPRRLSVRGIDQQGVERAVDMIQHSIAMANKEEMADLEAAGAVAPQARLAERLFTKIIRRVCS